MRNAWLSPDGWFGCQTRFLRSRLRDGVTPLDQTLTKLVEIQANVGMEIGYYRNTGIVLCSRLLVDVESADLSQLSSQEPKIIEAALPVLEGFQCGLEHFWEYVYMWLVIQFIHIHAVRCDSCHRIYCLFISMNHVLPYAASYLMFNTI